MNWKNRKRKWIPTSLEVKEFEKSFGSKAKKKDLFLLLKTKKFLCRDCASKKLHQKNVRIRQYAGGGGIQGLELGSKTKRPGIVIETVSKICPMHKKVTHDRWNGKFQPTVTESSIPSELQIRIFKHYKYIDAIEGRKREPSQLVADHRFPRIRFETSEDPHDPNMTEKEIEKKFQLLKKDGGGNHNKLKTEACLKCFKTNKRGSPLGIKFYYKYKENWPKKIPKKGSEAEEGCVGCGWYDVAEWKKAHSL